MGKQSPQFSDYVLVLGFCVALYAVVLAVGGPLTLHEGQVSQTSRQMWADHDWLVPHYGVAPWLDRPPLPQWINIVIAKICGRCDREWILHIGPALSGTITVLLTVWLGGVLFGRGTGILAGLILATMYEFVRYATLAENDMFLCPIVTGCLTLFAYLELVRPKSATESWNFVGTRPWPVLVFFILLGMTNLAKGLVFGTAMTLVPIGGFLLFNMASSLTTGHWSLTPILRYVWLWGWAAFALIALAWPYAVYQRYGDGVLEVWRYDLFGRLTGDVLSEPIWYYFANWFWVVLPWPLFGIVGLKLTAFPAFRQRNSGPRFLWCWAVLTPAVFSLAHSKHHHYMLHYLAPWGILSAVGLIHCWEKVRAWSHRLRSVTPQRAMVGGFAILLVMYWAGFTYKGRYLHRSKNDTEFLQQVRDTVPPNQPLLVHAYDEALEGLRILFYFDDNAKVLHNLSFLKDDKLPSSVFVLARGKFQTKTNPVDFALEEFGKVDIVLRQTPSAGETTATRREESPADRWVLFRVQLRDDLQRKPLEIPTPMQAMYRAGGPNL